MSVLVVVYYYSAYYKNVYRIRQDGVKLTESKFVIRTVREA